MVNTKKLRKAINAADLAQIKEILSDAPREEIRLAYEWTPLHVAAKRGNKDVVAVVLEAAVDINAMSDMHQTSLDIAVKNNHTKIIEFLRQKGARSGAELALHPAAAAGDLKAVRKHVAAGADINGLAKGERPLCIAFEHRCWDVAKFLLNKKCDCVKPQHWGITPLHIAASTGAPEVILSKLIKEGAIIDAFDECSHTPLCNAAEAGNEEIVDWLLDHGADVTRGRENSSAPVHRALYGGHVDLASHLIDRGAKSTLHQAVKCNHLVRARQKLNGGADANELEDPPHGNTPLELAIWLDSAEMVSLLLEFGADPNQQDRSFQGQHGMAGGDTSLHEAVHKGSAKMVKLLLANGADPDIANADGHTPIEVATRRDRMHLANLMEAHLDKKLSLGATQTGIEPMYTVQKVAELLSVDDTFILDLIKTRKITGLQLDPKTLRITAGSVQRYLAKLAK